MPPVEGEEMSPEAKAASIVLEQLQESMGGPDGFVPANPSLAAIHAAVTEACQEALAAKAAPDAAPDGVLTSGPRITGPGGVLAGCALRGTTGGSAV